MLKNLLKNLLIAIINKIRRFEILFLKNVSINVSKNASKRNLLRLYLKSDFEIRFYISRLIFY